MRQEIHNQYKSLWSTLRTFYVDYGGLQALACSPFFHASLVLATLGLPVWMSGRSPELAIAIVPALLGFSIAAFTLSLGIGSDKFRILLGARIGKSESVVANMSHAFLHFIIVQVIALIFAIMASGDPIALILSWNGITWMELAKPLRYLILFVRSAWGWFVLLLVTYALLSLIPAMLHIYRASKNFRKFAQLEFEAERIDSENKKKVVIRRTGNRVARQRWLQK